MTNQVFVCNSITSLLPILLSFEEIRKYMMMSTAQWEFGQPTLTIIPILKLNLGKGISWHFLQILQ